MFAQQESLFSLVDSAVGRPEPDVEFSTLRRRELTEGAWIDHAPGWLLGDSALFDDLSTGVEWSQPQVAMYDRVVDTPRLVARLAPDQHPVLVEIAETLSGRYEVRLDQISANWYRDGNDSVAWHGDRLARELDQAIVATISLKGPRDFRYRPAAGGPSERLQLGHGDLTVMGGSFQRTWRHCIPKSSAPVASRMVVMFRHAYD